MPAWQFTILTKSRPSCFAFQPCLFLLQCVSRFVRISLLSLQQVSILIQPQYRFIYVSISKQDDSYWVKKRMNNNDVHFIVYISRIKIQKSCQVQEVLHSHLCRSSSTNRVEDSSPLILDNHSHLYCEREWYKKDFNWFFICTCVWRLSFVIQENSFRGAGLVLSSNNGGWNKAARTYAFIDVVWSSWDESGRVMLVILLQSLQLLFFLSSIHKAKPNP